MHEPICAAIRLFPIECVSGRQILPTLCPTEFPAHSRCFILAALEIRWIGKGQMSITGNRKVASLMEDPLCASPALYLISALPEPWAVGFISIGRVDVKGFYQTTAGKAVSEADMQG